MSMKLKGSASRRSGLRAFVLARHSKHGVLLLEGSKARKGGRFFQLPGGHVDARELLAYGPEEAPRCLALPLRRDAVRRGGGAGGGGRKAAGAEDTDGRRAASRVAAARELYEETGMDFRDRLYRLRPVELEHLGPDGQRLHANGRRYFECVSLAPPRAGRARALSAREGERRLDISQTDAVCVEDIPPNRPSPPRTNRTRRVLHPVLIGHAASFTPY
jgi:8-oxo-dGTP pyrophosphatase MutT (NUDIX family)